MNASATILREVAVLGAHLGGLKETFEDFRLETRSNFDASKVAVADLKAEVKSETTAVREEMREGFHQHDMRLTSLEKDRNTAVGGVAAGRWIWGALMALVGMAGTVAGWVLKGT